MTEMIKCDKCEKIIPENKSYLNSMWTQPISFRLEEKSWYYKGWNLCPECAKIVLNELGKKADRGW